MLFCTLPVQQLTDRRRRMDGSVAAVQSWLCFRRPVSKESKCILCSNGPRHGRDLCSGTGRCLKRSRLMNGSNAPSHVRTHSAACQLASLRRLFSQRIFQRKCAELVRSSFGKRPLSVPRRHSASTTVHAAASRSTIASVRICVCRVECSCSIQAGHFVAAAHTHRFEFHPARCCADTSTPIQPTRTEPGPCDICCDRRLITCQCWRPGAA